VLAVTAVSTTASAARGQAPRHEPKRLWTAFPLAAKPAAAPALPPIRPAAQTPKGGVAGATREIKRASGYRPGDQEAVSRTLLWVFFAALLLAALTIVAALERRGPRGSIRVRIGSIRTHVRSKGLSTEPAGEWESAPAGIPYRELGPEPALGTVEDPDLMRALVAPDREVEVLLGSSPTELGRRRGDEPPRRPPSASIRSETCEIAWWRGYVKSDFYAKGDGSDDGYVVERSPLFKWRSAEPPPRTEPAVAACEALVGVLLAQGWEPAGRGTEWYSRRFRRLRPTSSS